MIKIISLTLLSSLLIPTLAFADLPPNKTEIRELLRDKATTTGILQKDRHLLAKPTATTTRPRGSATSTKEFGFCAQIDKALVYIDTKGANPGEKRAETMIKNDEERGVRRNNLDTHRYDNDTKRKNQIDELTKRATTVEQKVALAKFITVMDKALADKKTAMNIVLANHKKEVNEEITARKVFVEKALTTLTATIETAKTAAKSDCANGVAGDTVRNNLKDRIQKAQSTFKTTMQSVPKNTLTIKNNTRKKELQTIEDTYKKSLNQARKDLKEALSVKSPRVASTTAN